MLLATSDLARILVSIASHYARCCPQYRTAPRTANINDFYQQFVFIPDNPFEPAWRANAAARRINFINNR